MSKKCCCNCHDSLSTNQNKQRVPEFGTVNRKTGYFIMSGAQGIDGSRYYYSSNESLGGGFSLVKIKEKQGPIVFR